MRSEDKPRRPTARSKSVKIDHHLMGALLAIATLAVAFVAIAYVKFHGR